MIQITQEAVCCWCRRPMDNGESHLHSVTVPTNRKVEPKRIYKAQELSLMSLGLSSSTLMALKRSLVVYVTQLVQYTREEIEQLPGIGKKERREIELNLSVFDLRLKG